MSEFCLEDSGIDFEELLSAVATISDMYDYVEEIPPESSWQMKHYDLGRSELHRCRKRGLAQKAEIQMGSTTRWTLTEKTEMALFVYENEKIGELSTEQIRFAAENREAFEKIPRDNTVKFRAAEYNLRGGLLQQLHKKGYIRRVKQTDSGSPDVWQTTNLCYIVQIFYGMGKC